MVRRFDEVLTHKASKQRLLAEFDRIDLNIEGKLKDIRLRLEELSTENKATYDRFDEFTVVVQVNINDAVNKVVKKQIRQQES